MGTSARVRRITMTSDTWGQSSRASSTLRFRGMTLPPRRPSSAVMTIRLSQSWIRPAMLSGEKPPKITECTAPIRAQASMATAAWGIIGR